MNQETFRAGDVVRFRHPIDAAEAAEVYVVVEPRGDRTLVRDDSTGMFIAPTSVYATADLMRTGGAA